MLGNCSCVVGTSLYPAIAWVCRRRPPAAAAQTGAVYLPERSGQSRIRFGGGGGGGGSGGGGGGTVFLQTDRSRENYTSVLQSIWKRENGAEGGGGGGGGGISLADDALRCGILLI